MKLPYFPDYNLRFFQWSAVPATYASVDLCMVFYVIVGILSRVRLILRPDSQSMKYSVLLSCSWSDRNPPPGRFKLNYFDPDSSDLHKSLQTDFKLQLELVLPNICPHCVIVLVESPEGAASRHDPLLVVRLMRC